MYKEFNGNNFSGNYTAINTPRKERQLKIKAPYHIDKVPHQI